MEFYTVVLRQSTNYWVALCLENGLLGQGNTQEDAIDSFQAVYGTETNIYSAPISIEELHEFLMLEDKETNSEIYELSSNLSLYKFPLQNLKRLKKYLKIMA